MQKKFYVCTKANNGRFVPVELGDLNPKESRDLAAILINAANWLGLKATLVEQLAKETTTVDSDELDSVSN